jgi:hypothetical protein
MPFLNVLGTAWLNFDQETATVCVLKVDCVKEGSYENKKGIGE